MRADPSSQSCIDKLHRWLEVLGFKNVVRKAGNELIIAIEPIGGNVRNQYTLHILFRGQDIIFETFVWRSVSGPHSDVNKFQQVLLRFNALFPRINFVLAPLRNNQQGFLLQSYQHCSVITAEELSRILKAFDMAYTHQIPYLTQIAKKLELDFDGKSIYGLEQIIEFLLRKWS